MQLSRPFATITPTLDGDVLAVLASTDVAFTVPQMLRIVSRGSDEGLRNALSRLVGTGVVHQEKVGRTSTYRLNRAHLAAEPIIALAKLSETLHERLRAMTASWAETPLFATIFGSAATGRMRENSDIDLLLVRADDADDEVWDTQMTDLVTAVSGWTGNDARPVDYTESELRDAAASREPLLQDVVRDGLTFAGDRGWFVSLVRRAASGGQTEL
ncbi:nucleotidyltransferase domain-containing protein [Tsukamurella pseudospumae]|uniref:Polymerase beta nucleotidyltransferase domain-containing protein n=1 Tax=Tsukamurella pseudospumae TaxID=239498 RepID=A0A138AUK4_9ACTN|nr:nucleotidyltransferase domain-containing protein [Tsukamurella pseudospumae]KXO97739.1 hypothetical protein AXK61_22180 [Tsukamurella pseudospumae]KXP14114.1 hypothetical protein AXK60_21755 [Tsukamurella pseudospumae]